VTLVETTRSYLFMENSTQRNKKGIKKSHIYTMTILTQKFAIEPKRRDKRVNPTSLALYVLISNFSRWGYWPYVSLRHNDIITNTF